MKMFKTVVMLGTALPFGDTKMLRLKKEQNDRKAKEQEDAARSSSGGSSAPSPAPRAMRKPTSASTGAGANFPRLATKRIQNELKEIMAVPLENIKVEPTDDLSIVKASIYGPKDSPYEGGTFHLEMKFTGEYPIVHPKVTMTTPIYHPNFDKEGNICLNILRDEWSPVQSISTVLMAISWLIGEPNPEDGLDKDVAAQFLADRPKFDRIAKEWTRKYAIEFEMKPSARPITSLSSGRLANRTFRK